MFFRSPQLLQHRASAVCWSFLTVFFLSVFLASPQVLQAQSRCSFLVLSNHVLSKCVLHLSPGAAGTEQVQFFGDF